MRKNLFCNIKKLLLPFYILIYFILCFGYIHSYKFGAFPDELAHAAYISDAIEYGHPDYTNGLIAETGKRNYLNHPPLYYMVSAKCLNLFRKTVDYKFEKIDYRYVNVFVSFLTICYIYNAMIKLRINLYSINVVLSFIISDAIFIASSSSVNNDAISVFGATMIFGEILCILNKRYISVTLLYLGWIIVVLSKATSLLFVLCAVSIFMIIVRRDILYFFNKSSLKQNLTLLLLFMLPILYYPFSYFFYGNLFPAPQGNPSVWFSNEHATSSRFELLNHLVYFFEQNVQSSVHPDGHVEFPDFQFRIYFGYLCFLISLIIIFFCYVINYKKLNLFTQILRIYAGTLLCFICVYFIYVRSMHLETGYPGAVHGRYLLCFLPSGALVLSLASQQISNVLIKYIYAIFLGINLIMSTYPAYPNFFISRIINVGHMDKNFGELVDGRHFEQSFISKGNYLERVDLLLATFMRSNNCKIRMEVVDENNMPVSQVTKSCNAIKDNSWEVFDFQHLALLNEKKYLIRLTAQGAMIGNAVSWWAAYNRRNLNSPYIGTIFGPPDPGSAFGDPDTSDHYKDGYAIVDDVVQDADFSFKLYFKD